MVCWVDRIDNLIQCGIAEKPENKTFCGFYGFGFWFFRSAAVMYGLFSPANLHLFLTNAQQSLKLIAYLGSFIACIVIILIVCIMELFG